MQKVNGVIYLRTEAIRYILGSSYITFYVLDKQHGFKVYQTQLRGPAKFNISKFASNI
jgi:hypothetical protein